VSVPVSGAAAPVFLRGAPQSDRVVIRRRNKDLKLIHNLIYSVSLQTSTFKHYKWKLCEIRIKRPQPGPVQTILINIFIYFRRIYLTVF
jgi:hypothetical protein